MIHIRLDALCAAMQRHGVANEDLDALKLFVHRMLEATENRLRAARPAPLDGAPTQPDAPASITQRLRALADVPADDEPTVVWDPIRKSYQPEGAVMSWTTHAACGGRLRRLAGSLDFVCDRCGLRKVDG